MKEKTKEEIWDEKNIVFIKWLYFYIGLIGGCICGFIYAHIID